MTHEGLIAYVSISSDIAAKEVATFLQKLIGDHELELLCVNVCYDCRRQGMARAPFSTFLRSVVPPGFTAEIRGRLAFMSSTGILTEYTSPCAASFSGTWRVAGHSNEHTVSTVSIQKMRLDTCMQDLLPTDPSDSYTLGGCIEANPRLVACHVREHLGRGAAPRMFMSKSAWPGCTCFRHLPGIDVSVCTIDDEENHGLDYIVLRIEPSATEQGQKPGNAQTPAAAAKQTKPSATEQGQTTEDAQTPAVAAKQTKPSATEQRQKPGAALTPAAAAKPTKPSAPEPRSA